MTVGIKNNLLFAETRYKDSHKDDVFELEVMAVTDGQQKPVLTLPFVYRQREYQDAFNQLPVLNEYLATHFGNKKATLIGPNIMAVKAFLEEVYQKSGLKYHQHFSHRGIHFGSLYVYLNHAGILTNEEISDYGLKEFEARMGKGFCLPVYHSIYQELLEVLHRRKPSKPDMKWVLLALDVETGGLNPKEHSLLEAAFVACENGKVADTLHLQIAEEHYRTVPQAMEVNKINLEELRQNGVTRSMALQLLDSFLTEHYTDKKPYLLGHNVVFDFNFIKELCAEYESFLFLAIVQYPFLDTMSMIYFLHDAGFLPIEACHSQGAFDFFNIQIANRHRCVDDALATVELYKKLLSVPQ